MPHVVNIRIVKFCQQDLLGGYQDFHRMTAGRGVGRRKGPLSEDRNWRFYRPIMGCL